MKNLKDNLYTKVRWTVQKKSYVRAHGKIHWQVHWKIYCIISNQVHTQILNYMQHELKPRRLNEKS